MSAAHLSPLRRYQTRIFATTWFAYAGYYFCRKAFYVVKADMAGTLDFSTVQLANLGTAYLVAYMLGQFGSAYAGKRMGPKLLLLVGMGVSLLCNVFFGISNSFWTVGLFLFLNGLAQGTGWPGSIGSLAFWFRRKERGTVLGVWATCYQIGSVVASAFAAFLLGHLGWRWSFFGASLVLLVIWFGVHLFHPNHPEDVGLPPVEDEEEVADGAPQGSASSAASVSEAPGAGGIPGLGWSRDVLVTVLLMGIIYFCIKFLRYALWSWAPFFLRKNFGLAGDEAGYLSTVFDMAGFAGVLAAGFVTDRFFKGRRALLSFLMLSLMAIAYVVMYRFGAHNLVFFAVSMGVIGFMLYGPDSLLSGVGAIDVGSQRGALVAAGIINGMGSIGPVFQEQIIGYMYQGGQTLDSIFLLFAGMAIASSLLTLLLWLNARAGRSTI